MATATGSVLARTDLLLGSELLLLRTILVIGVLYNLKKYVCKLVTLLYTNIWKLCSLLTILLGLIGTPYASRQIYNTIQLTQLLVFGASLWLITLTILYFLKGTTSRPFRVNAAQLPGDLAMRLTDLESRIWRLERITKSLIELNGRAHVSVVQVDKSVGENSRSNKRKSRLVFKETPEREITGDPSKSRDITQHFSIDQQETNDENMDGQNHEEETATNTQRRGRRSTYHRCEHCGAMVAEFHKCWVLEQKVTCFKCGQPNHVAMVCKNQPGGMSVKFKGASKVDFVLKEIERLVKIKDLLMKNMKESVVEQTHQVEPSEIIPVINTSTPNSSSTTQDLDNSPFVGTPASNIN
ncbi:putative transmembrane protein [Gregarina niphandrodes]|uniref:Transmembrane protein n=1 Tax=Gregarina niphandrodes TaxID=110365 RepID=A0A023AW21_GRENI|nr:putative transmembrane protein [Gregarina niphandrodes]EZG42931.1 putative transmembrane protein [Gregarina niphandrodes]|eukprot:XP_011133792.1 putative transmembrane protein [Gregarina niphandrodes]